MIGLMNTMPPESCCIVSVYIYIYIKHDGERERQGGREGWMERGREEGRAVKIPVADHVCTLP